MKDGTMSVADTDEELNQVQESSPVDEQEESLEEVMPFENMQTELHSKGAVLTKAWSDLFSFITKYQAELVVKENSVEIAEKEIEQRKKQLDEMKPVVDAGNEEISGLQEEIRVKERLLCQAQSELSVKERMLQRVQSDLNCNMDMLEKSRHDLLGKQNDLVRYRGDLERLKSELTIKQEQIQIKDNLLKKLQNQLMKENSELKEQLELERRAHDLEKRSHELTKRSMLTQMQSESSSRKRSRTGPAPAAVIEIPDSPPTLDLSSEQGDFGLSNIISMAESQSSELGSFSHSRRLSSGPDSRISASLTRASPTLSDHSSRLHHMPASTTPTTNWTTPTKVSPSPSKFLASPSMTPPRTSMPSITEGASPSDKTAMTSSDTFFPLSVSATGDEIKHELDVDSMQYIDSDSQGPVPMSGPMPVIQPGTPSSGTSDNSNQGPVPISGPIPSGPGMSPGGSMEGMGGEKVTPHQCQVCGTYLSTSGNLKVHMRRHTDPRRFSCQICGKSYTSNQTLKYHMFSHTGALT